MMSINYQTNIHNVNEIIIYIIIICIANPKLKLELLHYVISVTILNF